MRKILLGAFFTFFSMLIYPVKAQRLCVRTTSGQIACGEPVSETRRDASSLKTVDNEIVFELLGCQMANTNVTCNLKITNVADSDISFWLNSRYSRGSRIIVSGIEYRATEVRSGKSRSSNYIETKMVRAVPISFALTFEGIPRSARSLNLLEFTYGSYDYSRRNPIQFRNVTVR